MNAAKQERGQRLWALFTDTPQLDDAARTEIAREAHKEASKRFRSAADNAQSARGRFACLLSVHSGASGGQVEIARQQLLAALDRLCAIPAITKSQTAEKRRLIGRIWLSAEGERFDRFRQSVASDEARLASGSLFADRRMSGAGK